MNVPDAPGADHCPPSAAQDYGKPCCTADGCGFDFGKGCTRQAFPNPTPVPEAPACGAVSGAVELMAEGPIQAATANSTAVYVTTIDGAGKVTLTRVQKNDCSNYIWSDTSASKIQATESALYYAASDHLVEIPEGSANGSVIRFPTPTAATPRVDTLGSDGMDLYAVVSYGAPERESQVMHVQCCGLGLATTVATMPVSAGDQSTSTLIRDGGYLFWLDEQALLEQTPTSSLVRVDLSKGSSDLVFSEAHDAYTAFGAIDGVVYLGGDGGVTGLHLPGCFQAPLLSDRRARITALALVDGNAFWAESAEGLAFSRVFTRSKGVGTPVLIASSDGTVPWISVDAASVYWLAYPSQGLPRVVRAKRP